MRLIIKEPRSITGEVVVPGDKSVSHRAAIFGSIAEGTTAIHNFLRAGDTQSTLACLRQLGADIQDDSTTVIVNGNGWDGLRAPGQPLDCGNSGTTIRLMMGILAGRPFESTLSGDESLSRRPMDRVRIPLQQMGAQIEGQGEKNTPPITVSGGNLRGIEYSLPVASAQVKSAILLAGLQAEGTTAVIEPTAARDHTERMLRGFGVDVNRDGLRIEVTKSTLRGTEVHVPGDVSSAAFFWCAAALRPGWKVTVKGVGLNSTRTGVLDVLRAIGAQVIVENESESGGEPRGDVTVIGAPLKSTRIDGALIPRLIDEIPVLALLATQCEGETVIADARELRVKESDRIVVLSRELLKLGVEVEEREDGMAIRGPQKLVGALVESPRGDHRIAMTLAVAGLIAEGETVVHNADAVESSFPNFAELLQSIGADARTEN
jgi:3-phosphoshikimate 1-carboxyvinyltransferase